MTETKKLTVEELQSIKDLQVQYNKFVFELGSVEAQLQQISLQKQLLDKEKAGVMSDIANLAGKEKELVSTLQDKYGAGSINIETGEISTINQ